MPVTFEGKTLMSIISSNPSMISIAVALTLASHLGMEIVVLITEVLFSPSL